MEVFGASNYYESIQVLKFVWGRKFVIGNYFSVLVCGGGGGGGGVGGV